MLDLRFVGFLTVAERLLIELFAVTLRRTFELAGANGRPRLEAIAGDIIGGVEAFLRLRPRLAVDWLLGVGSATDEELAVVDVSILFVCRTGISDEFG